MQETRKTNEDWLRSLPRKDLAALLIGTTEEPDYDEGIDGEWYECGTIKYYVTSDGLMFWYDDYESALQHECWWLAQDAVVCGVRQD